VNVIEFLARINNEADRTVLHSPPSIFV